MAGFYILRLDNSTLAAPQGGVVVSGQANISAQGNTTNINQSSNQAIINWQLFSIAPKETVNFNQPSATSVTLNRVIGNEKSVIEGALNANGQVFIVNSAGIVFTKSAQVNVGGLVASTLDISNSNFLAGKYQFSGKSTASVINNGNIQANPGGYVALLGNTVSNQGTITATLGAVALASGDKITLNIGGNSLVDVTTDAGVLNALVENKGAIVADGGKVILTARAASSLLAAQVNNSGVIRAQTLADLGGAPRKGSIKLVATGGRVNVAGRLDASAPKGGDGGTIETSGDKVSVANDAVVTTAARSGQKGLWLLDPDGFTIAASGGDITGSTLGHELASTSVTILSTSGSGTGGNINVNDPVSWSANTTLTLDATKAINVNAVLTGSGTGSGLALNAGTDINVNAQSSLQVAALTAMAGGDVNLNAPQLWTNNGAWTFNGANINVNDAVSWSAGTLTLNAGSFINLDAVMTASNAASLVLSYNSAIDTSTFVDRVTGLTTPTLTYGTPLGGINPLFDRASGTFVGRIDFSNSTAANPLTINGHSYTLITSIGQPTLPNGSPNPHDLDVINVDDNNNVVGYYALASNLTATAPFDFGTTCCTLGVIGQLYLGSVFEGLGHNIDKLTISTASPVGLFANNDGVIRDVSLTNASIVANNAGASGYALLVGTNFGQVINAAASGNLTLSAAQISDGGLTGLYDIGGLVGMNFGIIYNGYANANIKGTNIDAVGIIAGENYGTLFRAGFGHILNSYATGIIAIDATNQYFNSGNIGGFIGVNSGFIESSSASVNIIATAGDPSTGVAITNIGGFVGTNYPDEKFTSDFQTVIFYGGVIDNSTVKGNISADANVQMTANIGGFAGSSTAIGASVLGGATMTNNFANVSVPSSGGGFAGSLYGTTTSGNSYNATAGGPVPVQYGDGNGTATPVSNTAPAPSQGQPQSTAAQSAAAARAEAQSLTQQATAQQNAVAQAAAFSRAFSQQQAAQITDQIQAATQSANVVATVDTAYSAARPPRPRVAASAGKASTSALAGPGLADILTTPQTQTEVEWLQHKQAIDAANARARAASLGAPSRTDAGVEANEAPAPRRHRLTPPSHATVKPKGSGFGATIHSIEIEGKQYQLHDKPEAKPQAPADHN